MDKKDNTFILDDRHEWFNVYNSDCGRCKHYNVNYSCLAFPDGIPLDILSGDKTHREVLKEQLGQIVYTKE